MAVARRISGTIVTLRRTGSGWLDLVVVIDLWDRGKSDCEMLEGCVDTMDSCSLWSRNCVRFLGPVRTYFMRERVGGLNRAVYLISGRMVHVSENSVNGFIFMVRDRKS